MNYDYNITLSFLRYDLLFLICSCLYAKRMKIKKLLIKNIYSNGFR